MDSTLLDETIKQKANDKKRLNKLSLFIYFSATITDLSAILQLLC